MRAKAKNSRSKLFRQKLCYNRVFRHGINMPFVNHYRNTMKYPFLLFVLITLAASCSQENPKKIDDLIREREALEKTIADANILLDSIYRVQESSETSSLRLQLKLTRVAEYVKGVEEENKRLQQELEAAQKSLKGYKMVANSLQDEIDLVSSENDSLMRISTTSSGAKLN
jgi:hypothetical protein